MKVLKRIKHWLDQLLLIISLVFLVIMVVVIILQVISRGIFSFTPSWSEELSRLLFVWVSFLGIAYGFKEKLHLSLGIFVEKMPDKVKDGFDLAAKLIVIALGMIMFIYGWKFTMLMGQSTMPGLGVPSGVLYAAIPVTGFFVTMYGIELLFKKGMHQEFNDVEEE